MLVKSLPMIWLWGAEGIGENATNTERFTDFQNKQMLKNDLEFRVSLTRSCVGTYKGVM